MCCDQFLQWIVAAIVALDLMHQKIDQSKSQSPQATPMNSTFATNIVAEKSKLVLCKPAEAENLWRRFEHVRPSGGWEKNARHPAMSTHPTATVLPLQLQQLFRLTESMVFCCLQKQWRVSGPWGELPLDKRHLKLWWYVLITMHWSRATVAAPDLLSYSMWKGGFILLCPGFGNVLKPFHHKTGLKLRPTDLMNDRGRASSVAKNTAQLVKSSP